MPANLRPILILDFRPAAAVAVSPENVDFTATAPMVIIDAHCVATATQGGGTATLSRQPAAGGGYATVTAALALAVTSDLTRAAVITVAQRTIAVGDSIRGVFTTVNANGNLYAHMVMTPIAGAS